MKRNFTLLTLLFAVTFSFAGTPTIDGVFDGTGVWGSNLGGTDLGVGWPGYSETPVGTNADAKAIYITSDANYIYFGASMVCGSWMKVGFVINTVLNQGGLKDPWNHGINYVHAQKPDHVIEIDLGGNMGAGYAEMRSWTGVDFATVTAIGATDLGKMDASFVEVRIAKSALGNPTNVQAQFFISGNTDHEHGVFDAIPYVPGTDTQQTGWNGGLGVAAPYTQLGSYASNAVIPIEMMSFNAKAQNKTVKLDWVTASERGNAYFDVQRSANGRNWASIGSVKGNGTTGAKQSYNFTDDAPLSSANYYRLKQVDIDGKFDYSTTISVNMSASGKGLSIYPNPVSDKLNVVSSSFDTEGSVQVFDMKGSLVKTAQVVNNQLDVAELPIGLYQMRLIDRTGATMDVARFVKK
jgi:hypothetical protein